MALERALRMAYVPKAEFEFERPPEAPVFAPTPEEFADPLAYISRIRPYAEPFGICKIKPPADWQPPFALDVDKMRFVPRVQRLCELEAVARLRTHFRDRLRDFWELRGDPLRSPPEVRGRELDLFALHRAVGGRGGFEECESGDGDGWLGVVAFLGLDAACAREVREAYRRRLLPFCELSERPSRRPSEDAKSPSAAEVKNRELRRLAWYGAGPREPAGPRGRPRKRIKTDSAEPPPPPPGDCVVCRGDALDCIPCPGCSESYHPRCLESRSEGPRPGSVRWRCPACVLRLVRKPPDAFGFAQAEREYTLQEFGAKADTFKSEYFGMPVHRVPGELVEKEFWRVVSDLSEDVAVEYGADLHSMDHGSGFPTRSCRDLHAGDQKYLDSGWNLNNLPVLDGSVLRFINGDISGMTVPWMYVGMCFSAFCWHNEDHWSYSINFLHWGDAKTWYGVPGAGAETLESAMREIAPELFGSQPDLLHQLVTTLNPNVLSAAGVPVYRTDQTAGEFVVTFPRSYHAGFNQGYNFAEAVNFATPDWLSVGRECVLHYKSLKRFCVFSHDELVCKIGLSADELDLAVAIPAYKELVDAAKSETKRRGELAGRGVRQAVRRQFELIPDDKRACQTCKTTCFMSALACESCSTMVCLDHSENLCSCPPETLLLYYRYKLDELHAVIRGLKTRIQKYDSWMTDVKKALDRKSPTSTGEIGELLVRAKELKISRCALHLRLIRESEKAAPPSEIIEIPD